MDAKKTTENQNEPNEPLGPPEIGKTSQRTVPQLVRSTKSTKIEPTGPAETDDLEDIALSDTESETGPAETAPVLRARAKREPIPAPDQSDEPDNLNDLVDDPADPDGIVAEEHRQQWHEVHPVPERTPRAVAKKRHPFRKALLVLIIIAAATVVVFWFGSHEADKNNPQPATTTPSQTQKPTVAPAATTTNYNSTNFTLSLDYPTAWKLTDTTSKLTVASPSTQLTLADGSKKSGHVIVAIQNQQTTISGYPAAGAVAALASQKLTYKKPTVNQKAQTYLSFLNYGQQPTGLDAAYVTGDNGYQQGQAVPMSDVVKASPLISVTFAICANDDCVTDAVTPLTLQANSWPASSVSKDVATLLASIQFN